MVACSAFCRINLLTFGHELFRALDIVDDLVVQLDPATGEETATVAAGTPADALAACDAAAEAQKGWAATAPRVRSEVLRNCWSTLVDHTDELAHLITREHGKPLVDAAALSTRMPIEAAAPAESARKRRRLNFMLVAVDRAAVETTTSSKETTNQLPKVVNCRRK